MKLKSYYFSEIPNCGLYDEQVTELVSLNKDLQKDKDDFINVYNEKLESSNSNDSLINQVYNDIFTRQDYPKLRVTDKKFNVYRFDVRKDKTMKAFRSDALVFIACSLEQVKAIYQSIYADPISDNDFKIPNIGHDLNIITAIKTAIDIVIQDKRSKGIKYARSFKNIDDLHDTIKDFEAKKADAEAKNNRNKIDTYTKHIENFKKLENDITNDLFDLLGNEIYIALLGASVKTSSKDTDKGTEVYIHFDTDYFDSIDQSQNPVADQLRRLGVNTDGTITLHVKFCQDNGTPTNIDPKNVQKVYYIKKNFNIKELSNNLDNLKARSATPEAYSKAETSLKNAQAAYDKAQRTITSLHRKIVDKLGKGNKEEFSLSRLLSRVARVNNFACTGRWFCPECGKEMKSSKHCDYCGANC